MMRTCYLLLVGLFLIIPENWGQSPPKQGILSREIQLPIVVDGKTIGTVKLPAGSSVDIIRVLDDGVMISSGENPPSKILKEAITSESLAAAIPQTAISAATPTPSPIPLTKASPTPVAEVVGSTPKNEAAIPFALISKSTIDRIRPLSSSHGAERIIKWADDQVGITPKPMAKVHTEGTLPNEGIHAQSVDAEKDWQVMSNLAMAYALTKKTAYLQAAEKFLNAWVDIYQFDFDPIDETNMDEIIFAFDLTHDSLSQATRDKMNSFLRTMAEGYLGHAEKVHDDANWQSHRIKLATLAAYAIGDQILIERARNAFRKQLTVNIKSDGSVVDFYKRDALHYVVYDLEPLTVSALAAKAHGEDWFHTASHDNPSVEMAVDWLTPYATGQKTHEEFVHSGVAFDAKRAKAGLKGYSGTWDPNTSSSLYQHAALLDPKYQAIAQQILSRSHHAPDYWLEIVASAQFEKK